MKTFNNLEEMQPYYNANTDTYEFFENEKRFDVEFGFGLKTDRSINARNIIARNITADNIKAWNIKACDIDAKDIEARNIDAKDIEAWNITAENINAENINAWNITSENINAGDIKFFAVCFAYETFICDSIKGRHKNSRYFCLESEVVINKKEY